MRIAIAGTGAVGSVIAAYLMKDGKQEVSLLARGPQLAALRARGLSVESRGKSFESHPKASEDPAELGPQDVIVSTVKGYAVGEIAPRLGPMFGTDTLIITAQNGIPWWYFYGLAGADANRSFETVDPGGVAWKALGPEHAIGCVVSIPSEKTAPGHVHHDGALR